MNCLAFKAVTDEYMVIYTFTNMNTNAFYQKKIMLNTTYLPVLPAVIHNEYQFCFHDMYVTLSNMFQ